MKCRVCKNDIRTERTVSQHVHEQSPIGGDICTGCWMASVDLEMFLVRARPDRSGPMGAWAEGYLCAIIEDPRRFLE